MKPIRVLLACGALAAFFLTEAAMPDGTTGPAAVEHVGSFAALLSANEALNGLDVDLSFDMLGSGYGQLTVRVSVLEDATSVKVVLSLPDDVTVLGSPRVSSAVSVGDSRSFHFFLEVDEIGPFLVSALALGEGGPRQLTGSASLYLTRSSSGRIAPTQPRAIAAQQVAALPGPAGVARLAPSSGTLIAATPPVFEMTPRSGPPDPPEPLTALTVTGCFSYIDADGSSVGARNVWVRVWDDDILFDDLLWNGVAGADGCWVATGLTLEEESPSGNQDVYVQYSTWTNPAGKVVDGFLSYYSVNTPVTNEVPSSFFDSGSWLPPADPNFRAAFRVHAYLEEAWQFECSVGIGQTCATEPTLEAIVPGDETYYSTIDKRIRIEVNGDSDRSRDVVSHERGHWVMDRLLYEDGYWPPGSGGEHTWCGIYSQGLAWTEGWASFYALAKGSWLDSTDTSFDYGSGGSVDVESGFACSSSVAGDSNEYRVAGSLWDLYDASDDGEDTYSTTWESMWSVADDCTHPTFRAFYDASCSWASHGLGRPALLFPAWQNYVDFNVAPYAIVTSPNGGGWVRGQTTVSASTMDPDTPVIQVLFFASHEATADACSLIGSSGSSPFSVTWDTFGLTDDPSVWVCAQAFDGLEFSTIDLSDSWFGVDNTPPTVAASLSGILGKNGWHVSVVAVSLNAVDSTSGPESVQFQVDGVAWETYGAPFEVRLDGTHLVEFTAVDGAGNMASLGSVTIRVDQTPPEVGLAAPVPGSWTNGTVTIRWTGDDATSGLDRSEVSIDGGAFEIVTTAEKRYDNLPEGTHAVLIRTYDIAGNSRDVVFEFRVDRTAPSVSITEPTAGTTLLLSSVTVRWSLSDDGSFVKDCWVSLDGGAPTSVGLATSYAYENVIDGNHDVLVVCYDNVGNRGLQVSSFRVVSWILPAILTSIAVTVAAGISIVLLRRRRRRRRGERSRQPARR